MCSYWILGTSSSNENALDLLSALTLESIQDNLGGPSGNGSDGFLRAGTNVTISYDDTAGTLTISSAGGGGGGGGITLDQARDVAGALLGTLSQFTYNAVTNALAFALAANSVTAAQAQANTQSQQNAWLSRLSAAGTRGTTFTGSVAGIAPTDDTHFMRRGDVIAYVNSRVTPVLEEHIRAGWSSDTSISDAELSAISNNSDTVTLPTASGLNYLALWRADQDGGDPEVVNLAGGGNSRNLFSAAVARTISGTAGQLIVSVARQNADLLSGESARLS